MWVYGCVGVAGLTPTHPYTHTVLMALQIQSREVYPLRIPLRLEFEPARSSEWSVFERARDQVSAR